MEEQSLQLEENQRTNQQTQDQLPYDPNSAAQFPDGYTPVGEGIDNTGVEQAPSINVGEFEATTPIDFSKPPFESYGSSGDEVLLNSISTEEAFNAYGISITPVKTDGFDVNFGNLPVLGGITDDSSSDSSDTEPPVEPPTEPPVEPPTEPPTEPPVEPPVEPPTEPPVEPPTEPPVEPPTEPPVEPPTEPPVEPPTEPPVEPPTEPPVEPPTEPPTDSKENNGFGNGDQDAPGNSGPNNNAENDETPGQQGKSHQNDFNDGGSGRDDSSEGKNNGWGNGDQDAPGNSKFNNNAENDQTPDGDIGILIDKFVEETPGTAWYEDFNDSIDLDTPEHSIYEVPEIPMIELFADTNYESNFPETFDS